MPSTSAPNTRSRAPLAPLPLSRYAQSSNIHPSPISLPLKRNAPSHASSSSTSTLDSPKIRKVSYTDEDGIETIKRTRVKSVTPKAKVILDEDELGLGRSPARKLFTDELAGRSLGIVGAIPAPPSPSSLPPRSLAPSPPISSRSSPKRDAPPSSPIPSDEPTENNASIHDVGFAIFSDDPATLNRPLAIGLPTPDSKKSRSSNPPPAIDAAFHIPSSPASSTKSYGSQYDEDQENIPPELSHSASSTPSKRSTLPTSPSSKHSKHSINYDEEWAPGSGSRSRRNGRSKLGMGSFVEVQYDDEDGEGEELTPGRRFVRRADVMSAKGRFATEVNRI